MYNTDIFQAFQLKADRLSQNDAVVFGEHTVSYERLLDAVNRLASGLSLLGVHQTDSFAIMLPNLPQFVISYFALLKLGVTVILIDPEANVEALKHCLLSSDVKGIVALDRFADRVERAANELGTCRTRIYLGDNIPAGRTNLTDLIANSEPGSPASEVHPENVALILFTAGTTGEPKGVRLTHENLAAQVYSIRHALALTASHTVFCFQPLHQIFGNLVSMAAPLTSGSRVVLFAKFDASLVNDAIREFSNIVLYGDTRILEQLLESNGSLEAGKLVMCISAAGHLSPRTRGDFHKKFGVPIQDSYGLTEGGAMLTLQELWDARDGVSVGFPNFGVQIKLVDFDDIEASPKDVGEILVRSVGVMKGYARNAHPQHRGLENGWLHTGDLGRFDATGRLYLLGRKSNLIRKAGFPVIPEEVEGVLLGHPNIEACRVVGIRNETLGEEIKAFIVPKDVSAISIKEMVGFCENRLPKYKCPKHFEIMEKLN